MGRSGHAELEYRLLASSSVGVSDNPKSLSTDKSAQADGFVSAQGGFQLGHIGRLTQERIAYGIMATAWFRDTEGSSLTHTLKLSSEIQAGPETRITLSGGATLAQLSMVDTAAATDPQAVGLRPAGNQEFVSVDAGEALSWQLGAWWHVDQALQGRLYRPISSNLGSAGNKSLTHDLEIARLWLRDRAGLRSRVGAISASSSALAGQPVTESRNGEFAELALSWKHDWTPELSHELAAGVFVLRVDETQVLPAGSASLLWRRTGREIELRAASTAESNIYVGSAYERSFVNLSIALPVDRRETLRLLASADLEHDSTAAVSGGSQTTANVFFTRLGLRWQPGDTFAYGLEYTFRDQRASAPSSGASSLSSTFRRQMAMFTIEMQYPSGLL
jgi:hypothetical protein